MSELPVYRVPGSPGEAGFAHGRMLAELFRPAFFEAYLERLAEAIGFDRGELPRQAETWLERLPERYAEEIEGMGMGAGVGTARASEFLFADIARGRPVAGAVGGRDGGAAERIVSPGGPMCSAIAARLEDGAAWIGRNCDWLTPTLMRGTAAVVHETPGRIPVMAVGIRGDIDVDTGINAERLWLHLHTLAATDDPPPERTTISWLFWAREALETCATLEELEGFIARTGRDRGVIAVAGDGKTDEVAVFECSKAAHVRRDVDPAGPACLTNHSMAKEVAPGRPEGNGNAAGTISRLRTLRAGLEERPPRRGPDDLIGHLAATGVEMRTPRWLRTIYSAVVRQRDGSVWFAAGGADGTPAASCGRWTRVASPW